MKTISKLDRRGKVHLLRLIQSGEVDKGMITPDTLIVEDPQDAFLALMKCASLPAGEETPIVLIGKAKKEMERFFNSIEHNDQ